MQDEGKVGFVDNQIKILYEDDCCIVFEKPPGLLVIPTPKKEKNTLDSIVNLKYAPSISSFRLHPCHRLDRETSGAIIFAKGKKNQQLMMDLFKRRAVKKKYVAFVHGKLKQPDGELRSSIRDYEQKKFSRYSASKIAITRFRVKEIKKSFSIIEVNPITGRTNQIRIQFSEAGFPLVGERKYAFARDFSLRFKRVALHACELEWRYPASGTSVKVISPLAKDMADFILKN